ncbi:histidine acid phosphatase [Grosmannia clavigera kw1407]|uniref:Histidine acid phosphatase n=1 Tax=Grosmannia clavigera (strain kw1407 / UAMH 11150) TaxID=655863 RepID=F0XL33_GROCL|nr:histidine acid phosphatase [Grosmannia clavigera kw1407]EFX01735.1 histidine acid phosphatase [Grosmannia clavigera kw1407]
MPPAGSGFVSIQAPEHQPDNITLGTYGGLYTALTEGPTTATPYGTYDYCSMPHPRTAEYQLPAPLRASSDTGITGKLVFLEYLQRHQCRIPYKILPGGETYQDETDPFSANVNGTCQFPQITLGGIQDGYQHGQDLWAVYGEKLGLIPASPRAGRIWLRATDSPLTQGSAGAVLRGMWPGYKGAPPLHLMEGGVDTVNAGYSCNAISSIQSQYKSTSAWATHLELTTELRASLGSMLGATAASWQNTFDHFADNLQGRLCNGYELPCSTTNSSACVTEAQADMVFRAGDWEWNYYYRTQPYVDKYIQAVEGLFIGEVVAHLQAVLDGSSALDYAHHFLHDNDIGPVLGALGINAMRWPAMAANVALEVCGQPIETIHGILDWIPLQQLISILRPYVLTDIASLCSS